MSKHTICNNCGGKSSKQSKSGLCYKCWLEKVRKESPYINGGIISGGSQYKRYGKTHYERNRRSYIDKASKRRRGNWKKLIEYKKELFCLDCRLQDYRVIDFDHRPGTKIGKKMEVGSLVNRGCSWGRILEEIKKCDPRCSNCHRIKSWERRQATIS